MEEQYIVSARKYRPSTFQSVVGQKSLVTTLKNAIAANKLAHAYLFCGPRGVGKTTCARIFSKTINCFALSPEGEACNECESCRSFNEQRSLNVHELDAASNNGIDDIRSLIEQVRIPPQLGKYKVYIIDEVHMLSDSAFNAFLKTLEEPPSYAIFILATTEKHKILPTILSRCQIYDFSRISVQDIVDHLQYVAQAEGVQVSVDALHLIAQKADGGMRDALSIFDQIVSFNAGEVSYQAVLDNLNVLDFESYFTLTEAVLQGGVPASLLLYNDLLLQGFEGQRIITDLGTHFRNLLVCKDQETLVLFESSALIKEKYQALAENCSIPFLYQAMEWTNDCDLKYRNSENKRLLAELLLIKLCQYHQTQTSKGQEASQSPLKALSKADKPVSPEPPAPSLASAGKVPAAAVATPPKTATPTASSAAEVKQTYSPKTSTASAAAESSPKQAPVIKKSKLGLSLKNTAEGEAETSTSTGWKIGEVEPLPYTEANAQLAWRECATQFVTDDVHLQNTMLNSLPSLVDEQRIEVVVANPEQESKLNEQALNILSYLRPRLQNPGLQLKIQVNKEKGKNLAFTDKEKYLQMAAVNPSLGGLVKEFGLRLD